MYNKSISTLCLLNLWKISSTKTNRNCPCPIHHISPIYVKRVFMKIQYFKSIYKFCELQGRGEHSYCTCEQILDYTNNPGNVSLSFCTLSSDLQEILDSVRSDTYIQLYSFGPNYKMRVKMPNLSRNIKKSNGEVFFSTPFI